MEDLHSSEIVPDEVLEILSSEIGSDGVSLGRLLKLRPAALKIIEADYRGNQREINYNILLKWKQINGKKAALSVLGEALKKKGRTDLAEIHCEEKPKEEPAGNKKTRKRQSSPKATTHKRPKKPSGKGQTPKGEPAIAEKRPATSSLKESGPSKRPRKNPASKKIPPVKEKVCGPKSDQKGRKDIISLKIIDKEERGYPREHPITGTWFRGKLRAANESNWYYIAIWGAQEKMSLFKKGSCVTLKGFSIKGNDISFGDTAKVEECATEIRIGDDVKCTMEKYEKKSYKTLEEIKKCGQPSKTKLHLCEVGECKEIKRNEDGKKIALRELKARNKKAKKEPEEVVLFGDDARSKKLKEGQTIILNVGYNSARKKFETKGTFIMKICTKSKKKKSKKKQKSK